MCKLYDQDSSFHKLRKLICSWQRSTAIGRSERDSDLNGKDKTYVSLRRSAAAKMCKQYDQDSSFHKLRKLICSWQRSTAIGRSERDSDLNGKDKTYVSQRRSATAKMCMLYDQDSSFHKLCKLHSE